MENQDSQMVENQEIVETSVVEPEQAEQQSNTEEAKPTHVPLIVKEKAVKRAQEAERKVAELERQNAALEQERNLQQLVIPQNQEPEEPSELLPPSPDDFLDHDEWLGAQRKFNEESRKRAEEYARTVAREEFNTLKQQEAQTAEQQQAADKLEQDRKNYLERADKLNAPDFLEKEDALRAAWSPWFFNEVMSRFDNAEQVVYQLGSDIDKAKELAKKFDEDNFGGGLELVKYAASIGQSKQGNLPEPDAPITGGSGGVFDVEAQINKLRADKLAGKITMQQLMDKSRELRSKVA